jgi:hypothetical protein
MVGAWDLTIPLQQPQPETVGTQDDLEDTVVEKGKN